MAPRGGSDHRGVQARRLNHESDEADVCARVMAGEHGDFVREAVALVAGELMEAEVCAEVGAELGEVAPEHAWRIATGIARGRGKPGSGRSSF